MEISQQTLENNGVLIQLQGRLDASSSEQVRSVLCDLLKSDQQQLVVDLENVKFIDSSGLVALVSAWRLAKEKNSSMVLAGPQSQAQIIFRLTMLDHVFKIYPSRRDAQKSLI